MSVTNMIRSSEPTAGSSRGASLGAFFTDWIEH